MESPVEHRATPARRTMLIADECSPETVSNSAFAAEAWRRYRSDILRLAAYLLASYADAEDACQETFLRLLRYGPPGNARSPERKWILRVAVNVCRKMAHRRKRSALELSGTESSPAPPPSPPAFTLVYWFSHVE